MSKRKKTQPVDDDLALVNWDPKTNRVTCTSLDIAIHYGKDHGYVRQIIERHIREDLEDAGDVQKSLDIFHPDFVLFEGFDRQNRPLEQYAMTREGFMDIAVNFTGEKARRWKRRFRKAFSHYEKIAIQATAHKADPDRVIARQEGIEVRKQLSTVMVDLRDAIEDVQREGSSCAKRTISNITKLTQNTLFERLLPKGAKLRDWLVRPQLENLKTVEGMLLRLLEPMVEKVRSGQIDYHEPYQVAKEKVETLVMLLGGPSEVPDFVKGMESRYQPYTPALDMIAPAKPKKRAA